MHSAMDDHKWPGFPIQKSTDRSLFASSPWLIAGYNVFHRLSMPRHPPYALSSFITPTSNRQQNQRSSASVTHRGRFTPVTRRGTSLPHPGGCGRSDASRASTSKTLALGVTFKKSATPKNLSNCQRAMPFGHAARRSV